MSIIFQTFQIIRDFAHCFDMSFEVCFKKVKFEEKIMFVAAGPGLAQRRRCCRIQRVDGILGEWGGNLEGRTAQCL